MECSLNVAFTPIEDAANDNQNQNSFPCMAVKVFLRSIDDGGFGYSSATNAMIKTSWAMEVIVESARTQSFTVSTSLLKMLSMTSGPRRIIFLAKFQVDTGTFSEI
uniref:Uncharacterized protein n=1 Tax=Compsopogon caeruleus TaxID=31354 RepID=A0A7S1TGH5_9RHOD|mmetsp:Transcript_4813/g.9718  ORF Transcript_4813/g.9718 Transcript_4813/m.9718 type:complete len:106 (+) Transcript_4813:266-583(+)